MESMQERVDDSADAARRCDSLHPGEGLLPVGLSSQDPSNHDLWGGVNSAVEPTYSPRRPMHCGDVQCCLPICRLAGKLGSSAQQASSGADNSGMSVPPEPRLVMELDIAHGHRMLHRLKGGVFSPSKQHLVIFIAFNASEIGVLGTA